MILLQLVYIPVRPHEKTQSADFDNLEIAAVYNAISFSYPVCGRSLQPPTVSWAVQCVLTLDHLPVSPMSNANHTGLKCSANPAISKLLSHSFISPHRLHCGREHRDTKTSTRMCYNCNCNSNVSHRRCQCSALHNSGQFLYEHKHEAAIMNHGVLRLHSRFIKQPSHWRI